MYLSPMISGGISDDFSRTSTTSLATAFRTPGFGVLLCTSATHLAAARRGKILARKISEKNASCHVRSPLHSGYVPFGSSGDDIE